MRHIDRLRASAAQKYAAAVRSALVLPTSLVAILAVAVLAWSPARAQTSAPTPAEFYRGRTITVVVGFSVGGSFDLYARTLARHLGRHIPGNPAIVVQNMPGAGSLKAVDYLFSVAPRDGTVLGTFNHTVVIEPLLGHAKFDPRRLVWLGSAARESSVCIAGAHSPIKALEDLRRSPFSAGGTGSGSDTDMFANLIKTTLGLPIHLVTGYPGTTEMLLAIQRRELDGFCGIFYSSLLVGQQDLVSSGKIRILVQAGLVRSPAMPDVPMMLDYAGDDRQRQIMMLLIGPQTMARPFAMPPDTSAPRATTVRSGFEAMMRDPAFLVDAGAARLAVSPVGSAEIEGVIDQLYRTPPDVLQDANRAFGG